MFLYFDNEARELHVQKRMSSDVVLECTYTPRGRLHATLRRCGVSSEEAMKNGILKSNGFGWR